MRVALVVFFLVIATACSPAARQLFFDIPPASETESATIGATADGSDKDGGASSSSDSRSLAQFAADDGQPRPEIESVTTWKEAQKLLPKAGRRDVDWSEAVRQGIVRPRPGADPDTALAALFKYDFIIEQEDPENDAYFPHSSHTAWMGCESCHMSLFPKRRNPATMDDMDAGESCGFCHGRNKVAFNLRSCARCHPNQ